MTTQPRNVLIVAGNVITKTGLPKQLEALGYQVTLTEGGLQAFEILGQRSFDVIFLAIDLWGMNSYQFLERLKASDNRHIPVIILTSGDGALGLDRLLEM